MTAAPIPCAPNILTRLSHKGAAVTTNLLQTGWSDLDSAELRFILLERIGKPGQYDGRDSNPNEFYLPLAGASCRIKLTFSDSKQIVAIEPGPAFDAVAWQQVIEEIEKAGPHKVGRDCSFSSFRVAGSWRGERSGVQILPPPADAPRAPVEIAEHPFILEYPVKGSDLWSITNFRRMRERWKLTLLLNLVLAGQATIQPRRPRHLWAIVHEEGVADQEVKWVQEFYFAKFGEVVRDELSSPAAQALEEVDPESYYATGGHDGRGLRVPADLDDSFVATRGFRRRTGAKLTVPVSGWTWPPGNGQFPFPLPLRLLSLASSRWANETPVQLRGSATSSSDMPQVLVWTVVAKRCIRCDQTFSMEAG